MLDSIEFSNFKNLRDATLPLGQFTLIVGPNGSGKSTALQALRLLHRPELVPYGAAVSTAERRHARRVKITYNLSKPIERVAGLVLSLASGRGWTLEGRSASDTSAPHEAARQKLSRARIYSLEAHSLIAPANADPAVELAPNGAGLPEVLFQLSDRHPDRFERLNEELACWLPEFDRILFELTPDGRRAISLRTCETGEPIIAAEVSQGAIMALGLMTLAHLPDPPPIVGFEDPDHGMHPRLLDDVRDTLYRLAYPKEFGDDRDPVQVIATTHSPYFLDLFRERPEEIVIAEKTRDGARFIRLTDLPNIDEILRNSNLGEVWYCGILGGVPTER